MSNIVKTAALLFFFLSSAHGQEKGKLWEFAGARYERGAFVISTDKSPGQYMGKIGNDGVHGGLPPNADISLPLDQTSVFFIRHLSLVFTPLTEGKGFAVKRTIDLRSVRRGLKEESFSINISPDGEVVYGDMLVNEEPPRVAKPGSLGQQGGGKPSRTTAPNDGKTTAPEAPSPPEASPPQPPAVVSEAQPAEATDAAPAEKSSVSKMVPWSVGGVVLAGLIICYLMRKSKTADGGSR